MTHVTRSSEFSGTAEFGNERTMMKADFLLFARPGRPLL